MRRNTALLFSGLLLALLFLGLLCLMVGAVRIPLREVLGILFLGEPSRDTWRYIVLSTRLPQVLTAILTGGALSCSGLMMQTLFRNPLADPGILGISSGASLGVALVVLALGGSVAMSSYTLTGFMSMLLAALAGSLAVLVVILVLSRVIRNGLVLLVAGVMIGYLASSAISILNFFASAEGVQSYVIWGLGNFTAVSMELMPLYSGIILAALAFSLLLVKPLNALLLGERYAGNLGFNVRILRLMLLLLSGLLAAVTTAFCGPIAFIGLAVPHMARLMLRSQDHRLLMPFCMLLGGFLALLCALCSVLPSARQGILPINALTPLLGAPVVLYVLLRRHRLD